MSNLNIKSNFIGEAFERARRLQEKMRTNLVMAKDRLQVLGFKNFRIHFILPLFSLVSVFLACLSVVF